jgi:hypothetical protein
MRQDLAGAIVATMDWLYPLSGFVVGAIVGLTGMGGWRLCCRNADAPTGMIRPPFEIARECTDATLDLAGVTHVDARSERIANT